MVAIVTDTLINNYSKQTEAFLSFLQDTYIQENPRLHKFNIAWFITEYDLKSNANKDAESRNIYIAFTNCNYYFKSLPDVRKFIYMLRPDQQCALQKYFGAKEVKETLGFSGSGQHAYIKYLAKAMFCFMKNYYGEKDYLDQIYRLWGIFK